MFSRWGGFVYRFRRPVAAIAVVVAVVMAAFAAQASKYLSSGGWLDPGSESTQVADQLASDFGAGRSTIVAVFSSSTPGDATTAEFQGAIKTALEPLRSNPKIRGVVGYAETGDRRFISTAGDKAYVLIEIDAPDDRAVELVDGIRSELAPPNGYAYQLTGYGPLTKDSAALAERDLQRAETISLPIVAIVLILVFASIMAAGMPLLIAALAIPTTLGLIYFVSQQLQMSIYVLNIATMLGLALSIDYSLFVVSRFREELARGRDVGQAVQTSVATSGKAITFSGLAVAVGLSGLLLFRASAISSIGVAGALVVICTLFYALTLLPAVLGMLGPRVNALSVRGLFRRLGLRHIDETRESRWERVARQVMRHPIAVLVPVLAFLFLLGLPFFRLIQGVPDASVFPAGIESRDAYVAIQREFPKGETTPIVVLATVSGDPTSESTALALARYGEALAKLDGIDHVEGAYGLTDPATGHPLGPEEIAGLYATPPAQRPAQVAAALDALQRAYVRGNVVRFDAISPLDPARPEATGMTTAIRELSAGDGITTRVGGVAAGGWDFLQGQAARMPFGIGWTLLAIGLVLFFLFGSIAIPIKAVIMTLLSISASFGALVWIFQDGNLSNVLGFQPLGYTIAGNPIIMFSVVFGLSMDYEVLLLSRIQEAYRRTADNTASVAEGLAKTAGVITGAALIMVSVFAAFALADMITIKSIGVGMALAVLIDATVIRVFLVPATMRLLGDWNWYAPGPLKRLADRVGFDHVEDAADGSVTSDQRPHLETAAG